MRIFISWSGEESRALAEFLRTWLPDVLVSGVQAFVSSQDIEKGQRGLKVIADHLETIDYGIVLLTKTNQHAPWINFEAGALGKSVGDGRVAPLLLDLTQADVDGPLQQFQMTSISDREDVWKLLAGINGLTEHPVAEKPMRVLFESSWAALESAVTTATRGGGPARTTRPAPEILDEILYRVRRIERRSSTNPKRMGPSGLTREDEGDLIRQVFRAFDEDDDVRAGVKVGASGTVVAVSAPAGASIDVGELHRVADSNDVRIEVLEHGIVVDPRGRFRDPATSFKPDQTGTDG